MGRSLSAGAGGAWSVPDAAVESTASAAVDSRAALHRAFLERTTFGSLDAVRCLSILAVIWHHTAHSEQGLGSRGFLGVDMFFVLSGFLIVTLLLRERDKHGAIVLHEFYLRRALRILPLHYGLVLGIFGALTLISPISATRTAIAHDLPFLLTYTTNWVKPVSLFSITWSLSAEEQFYLLWPPVEKLLRALTLPILALLILLSELIACGVFDAWLRAHFGWRGDEPWMLRQTTFTPICLGVLLAHTLHSGRGFGAVSRVLRSAWAAPLLCVLLALLLVSLPNELRGWPRLLLHLGMLALLASMVVNEQHALAPLFRSTVLRRIGAVSYGMYLFHMPLENLARHIVGRFGFGDGPVLFLSCAVLTYAVAELSFRFYESPFLRLKARLGYGSRAVQPAPKTSALAI